ncbi:MAG: hypothetical protein P8M65_14615 [Roseibacillus sp.]|nr:hypothetical protein [Roseibacillus sp.]
MIANLTAGLVALAALILATLPSKAVELSLRWEPGKRYIFDNSADSSMKMPLPGQGLIETTANMTMRIHNDVSPHKEGVKVGHAFASVRMKQQMQGLEMEYDSSDPATMGGLLGTVLKPLTETKFAAVYGKDGSLVGTEGLDDLQGAGQMGMGKEELEAMARQSVDLLPGKNVEVGETWNTDVDLPMGELGGKVTILYVLKLEEILEEKGRKIARVSMIGTAKEGKADNKEEILRTEVKEATGTMLFDIELGQPLEIASTVVLETGLPAGIPQAPGAPGKMPLKTVSVQKLVGVEDFKEAPSAGKTESKGKPDEAASAESKAEKRARRKAQKEKRRKEKGVAE